MAPAPARRRHTTGIAAITAAVTALVLLIAGAVSLAANAARDGDGHDTSPTKTFTTGGYAIATSGAGVTDAPEGGFGDAGLDTLRVTARSDRPLFVGIARARDVERYLGSIEHGGGPRRPPADEPFWIAGANGRGTTALAWEPTAGDWRAVVMNADGSRGVTAELRFGLRTSPPWPLGDALLAVGLLGAAAAAALRIFARVGHS
jgi:hypothetical protein